MLYFACHTELVCLTEHLRGTRKSEQKKKYLWYGETPCSVLRRHSTARHHMGGRGAGVGHRAQSFQILSAPSLRYHSGADSNRS